MPKSRQRSAPRPRDQVRIRARARDDLRVRPPGVDPQRWQAVLAEARGDASTAHRLLSACGSAGDDVQLDDLATMIRHGESAPTWLVARWLTRQAMRWLRLRGDDRFERALYLSLQGTYWRRADLAVADLPPEYARVLADDWVTREIALYGYQALDEFLDGVVHPRLLAVAGSVRSWTRMPLRAYQLGESDEDCLVVTDLATERDRDVLDLGTGACYPTGSCVLGRLVPIGADVDLFESLPLLLDERTAVDIATAPPAHQLNPLPWALLLTRAIDQGRLPRMPGAGLQTPVVRDEPAFELPDADWEPPADRRWTELVEAGLDDELARWVQVLDEVLPMVSYGPVAIQTAADCLERIVPSPEAMAVVRQQLTGPEHARSWDVLADCLDGELRRSCADLAAMARQSE